MIPSQSSQSTISRVNTLAKFCFCGKTLALTLFPSPLSSTQLDSSRNLRLELEPDAQTPVTSICGWNFLYWDLMFSVCSLFYQHFFLFCCLNPRCLYSYSFQSFCLLDCHQVRSSPPDVSSKKTIHFDCKNEHLKQCLCSFNFGW